jgi:hypothetical protein
MRNNIIFRFIIIGLSLIAISGCAKKKESETIAIRVNDFIMSVGEFREELKDSGYSLQRDAKQQLLEDVINRKLLLQEAERMGLDKEKGFLREIEHFWEKTLLKRILDRKSNEFAVGVSVNEDEVRVRYDQMTKEGMADKSFEELYDHIKWQILREKQTRAFNNWLKELRNQARIEIDKELLGME